MPLFDDRNKGTAGFTGTQAGMSKEQRVAFVTLIKKLKPKEFRHGDCVGADSEAHDLVRATLQPCPILIHPPENTSKRAYKLGDHEFRFKSYLARNHDIVDHSEYLIATPYTSTEELRSGTWATVRYARKTGKKVYLILPNGKIE